MFDSTHVHRVRFDATHWTDTVDLRDFGVAMGGLDWSRLPAFRSPDPGGS